MKRKLRKQGNSIMVAVPVEVMERLNIKENEYIDFKFTKNGRCYIEKFDIGGSIGINKDSWSQEKKDQVIDMILNNPEILKSLIGK